MIRPNPLKLGDKIGLIAPSSPAPIERLEPSIRALQQYGLEVVVGESCTKSHGYFSGKDEIRVKDIHDMFSDPTIKGVFCYRGGYGAARLLPYLDFELIKENPKVFVGYSDITALHIAINKYCDFVTFHGPMPSSELYKGVDVYTDEYYKTNLFKSSPFGQIRNPNQIPFQTLVDGVEEGRLIGGNLALVSASIGTPYEIDTKDKILFLEDIGEYTYRIDRMLVQLKQSGKLTEAKGILLGDFADCTLRYPNQSLSLQEVFHELLIDLKIPVMYGIQAGHCLPTMTLPIGATIRMDGYKGEIEILD